MGTIQELLDAAAHIGARIDAGLTKIESAADPTALLPDAAAITHDCRALAALCARMKDAI